MYCGCSNCAALLRPPRRGSPDVLLLIHSSLPYYLFWHSTYTCRQRQGMAPTPFEAAFGNTGLIAKTKAALEAACDQVWCRQSFSELQLLEVVLSQLRDLSPTNASEETIRIVGRFRLACAPFLDCFLQELEKLQPDLDHYLVDGEDNHDVGSPPLWATAVERNTTTLMKSIGMHLQLMNALLRVESQQDHSGSGEIQQISKIPPDSLYSLTRSSEAPSQQYIMVGNENVYQGIKISGSARAHIGESHYHLGVPKASVDKIFENLNELATTRQADALQLSLQEMQKKQSEGCDVLSVVDARTLQLLAQLGQVVDGSRAMLALLREQFPSSVASITQRVNRSPSIASETPTLPTNTETGRQYGKTPERPRANRSTNLTSILEIIRTWLNALVVMLMMGSQSFQIFMHSTRTFIRSPSMLLDNNNIRIIDALDQPLSLPYEHFRSCDGAGSPAVPLKRIARRVLRRERKVWAIQSSQEATKSSHDSLRSMGTLRVSRRSTPHVHRS
jgi:hypothetical protein